MHICESCSRSIHGTEEIRICDGCDGEVCTRESCSIERDNEFFCTVCSAKSDDLVSKLNRSTDIVSAIRAASDIPTTYLNKLHNALVPK